MNGSVTVRSIFPPIEKFTKWTGAYSQKIQRKPQRNTNRKTKRQGSCLSIKVFGLVEPSWRSGMGFSSATTGCWNGLGDERRTLCGRVLSLSPVSAFHSIAVLSAELVAKMVVSPAHSGNRLGPLQSVAAKQHGIRREGRGNSQFTSQDQTAPLCPVYVPIRSPLWLHHAVAMPSCRSAMRLHWRVARTGCIAAYLPCPW
jgi:hypothetical protein